MIGIGCTIPTGYYLIADGVARLREVNCTITDAHKLDCESAASDCRFVVQSEDEGEAIQLARNHMREVHGQEYSDEELRSEYLQVV